MRPARGPAAPVLPAARPARDDYPAWLAQAAAVGGCSRPVRLRGQIHHVDPATGEVLRTSNTSDLPDGVIYTSCGDRRASVCPACAEIYRADTYQLIRAGLVGGKGIPGSVAAYPCVFATFTAPSFGPVHARITGAGGQVLRCRPGASTPDVRTAGPCPAPGATAMLTPAWASRCARTVTTTKALWCGMRMRPNCGGALLSPCVAVWTSSPATTAPESSRRMPRWPSSSAGAWSIPRHHPSRRPRPRRSHPHHRPATGVDRHCAG
jgi:hypothetical protein